MTENLLQAPLLLEALVDCLVLRQCCFSHSSYLWAFVGDESLYKVWKLTKVTSISFHSFTFSQMVFQCVPKDRKVRPVTRRERPVDPYNVTSFNAQSNFIAQTGAIEFV